MKPSPLSPVSTVLFFLLFSSHLLLSVASLSLRTFSDASCSRELSVYSYFNAKLNTNRTKGCFPVEPPSPLSSSNASISAFYILCSNTTSNTDYVTVDVDTFANDKTCNHKQPANIQWDVTSFYPRQGTNTDIPQGRCTAVQLKAGGDVDHWASNQTAYAIVRCGATTQPESDNSTDSTTSGLLRSNTAATTRLPSHWTVGILAALVFLAALVGGQ